MCGIAGFAGLDDARLLKAMCDSLAHRGPDDAGYYIAPGVGLAMRRLSIIDLATGHQPIANEARDVWVVLNGEIYNYEELRRELAAGKHSLATTSDTETIVHLYEDHGLDFARRLRGMFAIALWDERRRRLVLVRDRIGEKPLYYLQSGDRLLFGSEIKAILQADGPREVDAQAVCDYLAASYVGGYRTFYRGIAKLPPGHMLVWEQGKAEVRRYWQPRMPGCSTLSFEAAERELAHRLSDTVRLCLRSDVEVGAFLSGGIDSSVMVALMRKHSARVQTFSVGYEGGAKGFSELQYAKRVALEFGTEHHELVLGSRSSIELLPRILWHYDEPHGEPTSILVYLLCEFTRQRVKVAVGGTGGDEIFFGYPRYGGVRLLEYYRRLPVFVRKCLVERVVARWPESTRGSRFAKRVKRFVLGSDLPPEQAYLGWVSLLHRDVRSALISDAVQREAEDPSGEWFLRQYLVHDASMSLLERAAALDIDGYLPEYQLSYMDRMSMAHGLEVRSPLCDFELVDFVTSLPVSYRLRGQRSKRIFKSVAARWLPRAIVERQKVGFDSPVGQWFKDELRPFLTGFLSTEHVERSGLLDGRAVQRIIGDHLVGRRDYSLQLWSMVALEGWYRMYIEDRVTDGRTYRLADVRGGSAAVA
ncbi:MAG: asparagine synthase (glutamine-hydrolyzing) [Candidatus Rokuibacteriota bacterium]